MQQIEPTQLAHWLADKGRQPPVLLDVREDWEVQTCRLAESMHIPLRSIPQRWSELNPEAKIVCICHHGMRSAHAAMFLARQGFAQLYNLNGGIDAWARQVDPAMPVY